MTIKAYEDALTAIRRCTHALSDARIDAEIAANGLCDARASRCAELAEKVIAAYQHAERLLFVLEADISTAHAEVAWERTHYNVRKF